MKKLTKSDCLTITSMVIMFGVMLLLFSGIQCARAGDGKQHPSVHAKLGEKVNPADELMTCPDTTEKNGAFICLDETEPYALVLDERGVLTLVAYMYTDDGFIRRLRDLGINPTCKSDVEWFDVGIKYIVGVFCKDNMMVWMLQTNTPQQE